MAATDLVYNTVDPVLFTPDYAFLRYNLDKKQARYDQGLDAVSKAYNNLKRPVTDPVNAERRDQFLKDAQGQLQKIASSDLSLAENIGSANNVFDPLATNPAFIFDAYHTDRVNKELTQMKQWSESDDMETRKKFNPKMYSWLQNDLDSLKEGKGDINNYKGVKGRSAFAYLDAQDILNKAVKDSGFTVSKDIDGGTYIYGVEGGVAFKKNYKEFANQILGSNSAYQTQLGILGESDYESLIKQGKQSGKNDQQILSDFAFSNYTAIKTNRSNSIEQAKQSLENINKDLIAQANNGKITEQELAAQRKQYDQDLAQYNSLKADYENNFGSDDKSAEEKKNTYLQSFLSNPKSFLSQQYRDNDINTFSNIRSTFEKTTIKPNTAYFNTLSAVNAAQRTNNDILKGIENTEIKQEAQDLKERHEDWLEAGKPVAGKAFGVEGATENVTTVNADGTITTTKQAKKPQLTYIGPSGVDITKTLNTLNAIDSELNIKTAKSIGSLASDSNGGALGILGTMGVKRENIQTTREYFIKQQEQAIKDPSKPYKPTLEESKALNDVYSSMFAFAKQNGDEAVLNKLRQEYGKKPQDIDFHSLLDVAISQTKFKDAKDWAYVNQWNEHKKANEDVTFLSNILTTGKSAVVAHYSSNPEFNGIIIKDDKNTSPHLIGQDDIYNKLKNVKYFSVDGTGVFNDDVVALPEDIKKKIANGYINGTLDVDVKPGRYSTGLSASWIPGKVSMKVDGQKYYFEMGPSDTTPFPMSSKEYNKKIEKINSENLLPEINPEFKEQLLASPIWNLAGGMKNTVVTSLAAGVTQYSSNIMTTADGRVFDQIESSDDQMKIRGATADPKNIAENGVYVHSKSNANNAGMAIAVTFAAADSKEEKADCVYCGNTYYFPINPSKGTPDVLQAFNTINDETEYNRIKNSGKMYDMYNYDAMGIKVQILPHTKGSATGDVIITVQKQDPITHQFIPNEFETIQDTYNVNTQTYDELKEEVYSKVVSPFITNRIAFEKQNSQSTVAKNNILKGLVLPQ